MTISIYISLQEKKIQCTFVSVDGFVSRIYLKSKISYNILFKSCYGPGSLTHGDGPR